MYKNRFILKNGKEIVFFSKKAITREEMLQFVNDESFSIGSVNGSIVVCDFQAAALVSKKCFFRF